MLYVALLGRCLPWIRESSKQPLLSCTLSNLAAMFLGGPGKPYGAMLGAVIIGVSTEMSAAVFNPQTR